MDFSKDQLEALDALMTWYTDRPKQVFTLGGYAGVGKTTIIQHFTAKLPLEAKNIAFLAYTGKACGVLRRKGNSNTFTLHRFLYEPVEEYDGKRFRLRFKLKNTMPAGVQLIIVDEASMVPGWILTDLLSMGLQIVLIGDPGQLPPIDERDPETKQLRGMGGMTYLTRHADYVLTQIHRQAEGNPIIQLSKHIREGHWKFSMGAWPDQNGVHRMSIVPSTRFWMDDRYIEALLCAEQILVGSNQIRSTINREFRRLRGYDVKSQYPVPGEKLIATKNNWKLPTVGDGGVTVDHVTNGTIFYTPSGMHLGTYSASMKIFRIDLLHSDYGSVLSRVPMNALAFQDSSSESKYAKRPAHIHQSMVEADFAYAITVHKAQGSQFTTCIVFDESDMFGDAKFQWLYTAVTRASDQLILVTDNIS